MRVEASSLLQQRSPRCADFDLSARWLPGHPAEGLAGHRRHRAARRVVVSAMALECIDQPRPAHTGQQGVCHHLWIEIGSRKRDAPEGTLPCGVAGRVVEQDETTTTYLVTVRDDVGGDGRRVRRNALRRREFLDL